MKALVVCHRLSTFITTQIGRLLGLSCFLLLSVIMASMSAQIVFRYALGTPLRWPEEISRYLFIWLVFLGAVLALQRGQHFSIDFLPERAIGSARLVIRIASILMIGAFLLILFQNGVQVANRNMMQLTGATRMPVGVFYYAIPVSAALMVIICIHNLLSIVMTAVSGRKEEPTSR